MSEAVVEVPNDDIPEFQLWLASQAEELTNHVSRGVETEGAATAIDTIHRARQKLEAIEILLTQGHEAAIAEKSATYRGDAKILLSSCHAMADGSSTAIKLLERPEPPDYAAAEQSLEPLSRWLKVCREIHDSSKDG